MPRVFGGAPKCHGCQKSVYAAEELNAIGYKWHKPCFKCTNCQKTIAPGKEAEHDDKPWCKNCYGKMHGPKGIGGGATAGCLSTDDQEEKKPSKYQNTNEPKKVMTVETEKCVKCETTVYAAEKVIVLNKILHKTCVKCFHCDKTLTPGEILEHEDNIWCKNCHGKELGPDGTRVIG
jgi:cysteine/glycine-rich protein